MADQRTKTIIVDRGVIPGGVDMAMMSAERGDDSELHAWLEEIQSEASKLVARTRRASYEATDET